MKVILVLICLSFYLAEARADCIQPAALQAAINAQPATGPTIHVCPGTIAGLTVPQTTRLVFKCGQYSVTASITFQNLQGLSVEGCATPYSNPGQGTVFLWNGNTADCMFNLSNVSNATFRDLSIFASGAPLFAAFCSPNVAPVSGFLSTHNRWERVTVNGYGQMQYGFRIAYGSPGSNLNNNDIFAFDHVYVRNYVVAGWSLENNQSKGHVFHDITAIFGQYGIATALAGNWGASFYVYGFNGGYNAGADLYLGSASDPVTVIGGEIEGSARLLLTAEQSSVGYAITLQGISWKSAGLATDNCAVTYTERGPLNLIGNMFGNGRNGPLAICMNPTGPATANVIGNQFWTTLTNPLVDPYNLTTWSKMGNIITDPTTGRATPMP